MKKDIQYTLLGFYLSETLKDYLMLETETVEKSILDDEGSIIDEIVERFSGDAERATPMLEYDEEHGGHIFKTRIGRQGFAMVSHYENGRFKAFKFKEGKRDAFFVAIDDDNEDVDLNNYMDRIDLQKDFDILKSHPFAYQDMTWWDEEVETTGERELIAVGTIYTDEKYDKDASKEHYRKVMDEFEVELEEHKAKIAKGQA